MFYDRELFPQEELLALYHLIKMAEARFLSSAKAGDFPFYFKTMPLLACREEIVERFLSLHPCEERLRTALEMCVHPIMLKVFEAWLQAMPSERNRQALKRDCKQFLTAYPEAAKKVDSL